MGGHEQYNYYLHSYIGNLLYCLEFTIDRMRDNVIRADPVRGRLLVRMEAILPGQAFLPNGVSDWALL